MIFKTKTNRNETPTPFTYFPKNELFVAPEAYLKSNADISLLSNGSCWLKVSEDLKNQPLWIVFNEAMLLDFILNNPNPPSSALSTFIISFIHTNLVSLANWKNPFFPQTSKKLTYTEIAKMDPNFFYITSSFKPFEGMAQMILNSSFFNNAQFLYATDSYSFTENLNLTFKGNYIFIGLPPNRDLTSFNWQDENSQNITPTQRFNKTYGDSLWSLLVFDKSPITLNKSKEAF